MTVVLAARPGDDPARLLVRGEALDQRLWHLREVVPSAESARRKLHGGGVTVVSVASGLDELEAAITCGGDLHARAIVVDPGARGERDPEDAVDRLVRLLHAHHASGARLAIRNGAGADDLLGFVETEWLLSELPRVALWFDPARAVLQQRTAKGPMPQSWIDAYSDRLGGLFVQGLAASGAEGAHPEEGGLEWEAYESAVGRAAPRVLELDPRLGDEVVVDALRFLRRS
ncbi:MAG: hypothetical protein O2894_06230 [Planctomycetota bacterium]|nr:hypothetical protein [Planctomycetota bacterium]